MISVFPCLQSRKRNVNWSTVNVQPPPTCSAGEECGLLSQCVHGLPSNLQAHGDRKQSLNLTESQKQYQSAQTFPGYRNCL